MFAVVRSGGKQYRVKEGQELVVDRLKGEVGDSVELPVGFAVDEGGFDLGQKKARVEILDHLRGEKIHVYKYKPKKDYRKKTGHRQELTRVKVLASLIGRSVGQPPPSWPSMKPARLRMAPAPLRQLAARRGPSSGM